MASKKKPSVLLASKRSQKLAAKDTAKSRATPTEQPASADIYQNLIQSIDGIIWEADAQTFEFSFVSQQAERLLGYPIERWTGEPTFWKDHIHPEDQAWALAYCIACTRDMIAHEFEYRMIAADGRVVWLRDIVTVIIEDNQPRKLYGVMVDVTERRRMEAALRESDAGYYSLIAELQVGLLLQGPNAEILLSNAKALELLGFTESQLLGKTSLDPDWNVIHEDGSPFPGPTHPVYQSITTRQPVHDVVMGVYRPATRDRVWLLVNADPLLNPDGSIRQVICTFNDITERKRAEDHLRLNNLAIESATEGIIITDFSRPDNPIIFANQTFYSITGYCAREVIGANCRFLQGKDTDRQTVAQIRHTIEQKRTFEGEILNYRKDGTSFWNFLRISPILDANGNCTHFVGFQIDITMRKQAEEELRKLHERFKLIGEAANDAVWEWDLETNIVWSNLTHQELFGLTLADPVPDDQEWKRRLHPDEREQIYQSLQDARASKDNIWYAEYRLRTDNKGWISIYARTYIERNKEGKAVRMIGSMMDITQRKQTDEALANERNLLRTLIDNVPDAIYVKDIHGRFLLKNLADARKMGAASPEETIGKSDFDYYPHELAARYDADDQAVIQSGQAIINHEEPIIDATGRSGWVSTTKVPLRDQQGRVIGLVGIGHDITERKQADEEKAKLEAQLYQAQKMEFVGRLAGGVAHDFNNMLGVILGHTELALNEINPALPVYADIEEIGKAAQRSANLTRQLLAFARQQVIAPKVLDLNETVAGMLKMIERMIGENIEIAWIQTVHLWPVKIDPTQVDQILTNLCVNARDAISDVGKITIETGNRMFDASYCADHPDCVPGKYVLLSVSDNGVGMDKKTQAHIFEPFYTTKPLGQGTGLGLATVYGIVKQNNGFITVSSELGQGTTFRIYLPQHTLTEALATEFSLAYPAAGGGETILVVEDEPSILKLSSTMLTRLGYNVLSAGTPGAAITIAETYIGEIHLLMTDVIMPEMNGRDLAMQLLIRHPRIKRLFVSGYTAEIIAHHGVLEAGVFFIQKPFSMKELAAKVREVVDDGKNYELPFG